MNHIYSVAQIRALEKLAIKEYGISESRLMQSAGSAAFKILQEQYPQAQSVVVMCGRGNNGGDGYVVARLAHEAGLSTTVYHVGELDAEKDVVRVAMADGIEIKPFIAVDPELQTIIASLDNADVIVDALLGIGLQGEVHGDYLLAIQAINRAKGFGSANAGAVSKIGESELSHKEGGASKSRPASHSGHSPEVGSEYSSELETGHSAELGPERRSELGPEYSSGFRPEVSPEPGAKSEPNDGFRHRVVAVDCPSGIDADTGSVLGDAVRADCTVTFIGLKKGLMTGDAPGYVGEVFCDDLNLPAKAYDQVPATTHLISPTHLPARKKEAHKGRYGHVLVIGGDIGMPGAARMAGEAAARVGAGLVSIATRPEHASTLNVTRPELMVHSVQRVDDILPLIEKATVLVIGPGLGQRDWGKDLLQAVLAAPQPKVIDADGLNLLAGLPTRSDDWVLTPHPGEAARLLGLESGGQIQSDRFQAIEQLQKSFGGVCVLKGAGTLVRTPGGEVFVCQKGNPGMASGGMGDVLSGVIGGLIAQRVPIEQAATMGVYVHAAAADKAVLQGGERGLLAMDVIEQLRSVINGVDE